MNDSPPDIRGGGKGGRGGEKEKDRGGHGNGNGNGNAGLAPGRRGGRIHILSEDGEDNPGPKKKKGEKTPIERLEELRYAMFLYGL